MANARFLERLNEGAALVADGATGTNLQKRGLPKGTATELWVLEQPEQIVALNRDFIAAGSDIILTCTFGGTTIRLEHAGLADRAAEINRTAAALAQKAAAGTHVLVAGSIGPTGQLLQPMGPLDETAAEKAFAEQALWLSEAGVDLLLVETQFDLAEAAAAVRGVRSVSQLPLVCSFSYDRGTRTMMGVKPTQAASEMEALGVDAIGINCGRSLDENLKNLHELRQATRLPIWFKPNAGLPHVDEAGNTVFDVTPEMMGARAAEWLAGGARIVGGCCGTSPEHLAEIARVVKNR